MSTPVLVITNEFGEKTINTVDEGTTVAMVAPIAAHSLFMNNTAGSAAPGAVAQQVAVDAFPAKTGVAAINAQSSDTAQAIALSTDDTYSDAAVNTAVNTALTAVNTQLNAIITKVNAILAALKVQS